MTRLLLAGSRRTCRPWPLRRRRSAAIEPSSRRVQILVGELLDQTVGAVIVTHSTRVGTLRGRQGLAIMRLGVLLGRVRVGHEISLAKPILSIHVILRSLTLINRLGKSGGRGGIGAIVDSGRIECTLIVPEVEVETIIVGVHREKRPSRI